MVGTTATSILTTIKELFTQFRINMHNRNNELCESCRLLSFDSIVNYSLVRSPLQSPEVPRIIGLDEIKSLIRSAISCMRSIGNVLCISILETKKRLERQQWSGKEDIANDS